MTIDKKFDGDILDLVYKHLDMLVRKAVREETKLLLLESQKEPVAESDFLSAEQAALFLKRKLPTIYKDVRLGKIPFYRSGPRKLLFSKTELEEYVQNRRVSSNQEIEDAATQYVMANKLNRK